MLRRSINLVVCTGGASTGLQQRPMKSCGSGPARGELRTTRAGSDHPPLAREARSKSDVRLIRGEKPVCGQTLHKPREFFRRRKSAADSKPAEPRGDVEMSGTGLESRFQN